MRRIAWFSCGAPSACTAKLAIEKYGDENIEVVYCDTSANEHPDNKRFFLDVQAWIGKQITTINNKEFADVNEVFEKTRFMASPMGARCTTELKKIPRFEFQQPDDIHLFGLSADETKRICDFEKRNPELYLEWILRDLGISRSQCLEMLIHAGIPLPMMYRLGFKNNNCLGCVKATSKTYWNAIRRHFPVVFDLRARQSRAIGYRLTRHNGERIFLDELTADAQDELGFYEDISCGPECGVFSST